jgi:TetR/AcrR family fatty acid metabolism transcriptional regulator
LANNRKTARESKKRKILEAAVQAFGRKGFHRTRISDIARGADVADGTVYLYFKGKDEILGAIFADSMERFLHLARRELQGVTGAVPRLRHLLELQLRGLGGNRELATIFQIELRHSARFMGLYSRGPLRDYFQLLQEILEEGKAEGTVRTDLDTWFATKCIFGILDETVTNWVLSERNYRLVSVIEQVMDFVRGGIGQDSAG